MLRTEKGKIVTFLPSGRVVAADGRNILQLAQDTNVPIPNACNGAGTCGKCLVVLKGPATPPTDAELRFLTREQIDAGLRLACQVWPAGDVAVSVPESGPARILVEGAQVRFRRNPHIRKVHISIPKPSLDDQASDVARVLDALGPRVDRTALEPKLLRTISEVIRSAPQSASDPSKSSATAVLAGNRLAAVEPGDTTNSLYGIAFDVGTTTVVGYLVNLNTGERLSVVSDLNPQVAYGADVIARITHTMEDPRGLRRLQGVIIAKLNAFIGMLCEQAGISRSAVYDVVIVGNTTMHHIVLGLEVRNIALAPYIPVVTQPLSLRAAEIGLRANPQARVHLLPNVAGYVGADIVADLLVGRIDRRSGTTLMIDFGTNGEIVLGNRDRILACATAAGPCFEGGNISCGMRATSGAISSVSLRDGDLALETIDGAPPVGVCGTGLIDAVAQMLRLGILEETGRILDPENVPGLPPAIRRRVRSTERGNKFVLCEAGQMGAECEIALTQRDIRELQKAKGAVYAGIKILCSHMGIAPEEIDRVLLAGAFGNYIRRESALAVGLIPQLPLERIRSIGNAAGVGAQMALLSTFERQRAERLARKVEYIELSSSKEFPTEYAEAMFFPTKAYA